MVATEVGREMCTKRSLLRFVEVGKSMVFEVDVKIKCKLLLLVCTMEGVREDGSLWRCRL